MKVLFVALVICAVAFATSVPNPDLMDKPAAKPAATAADNKTAPAAPEDKPKREGRYVLLENSGRIYDRVFDNVVSDIVLDRGSYRSSYVVDVPARRSSLVYY